MTLRCSSLRQFSGLGGCGVVNFATTFGRRRDYSGSAHASLLDRGVLADAIARLIFTPAAAVSICTCNPRTPTRSSIARRCVRRPTRSMRIERTDHFGCNERNPLGQAYRDALGAVAHLFTHRCNGGTRSALTRIRQRYNLTSWRTGPVVPLVHLQTSPEVLDQGGRLESALASPSLHVSKCCNSPRKVLNLWVWKCTDCLRLAKCVTLFRR